MTVCVHHWLIDSPNGRTSRGRCKVCGAERDFRNYPDWSGQRRVILPAALRAAIAHAKREEAALTSLIHDFGQDGFTSLGAYRRNLRRREQDS